MPRPSTRPIRIRQADDDSELTVPADVVDLFGPDAELELHVEPRRATIRRAGGVLRKSDLDGWGYVLPDPKNRPPLPRPMTDAEREALNAFLDE